MRYHYRVGVMVPFVQRFYKQLILLVAAGFIATMALMSLSARAEVHNIDFESYALGNINGQDGWSKTGSFDSEVDENTSGFSEFGAQSLRISNGVASGSFGDQTFAKPLADGAGEVDSTAGSFSVGTLKNHFEAEFDLASVMPETAQTGLFISVSPDRGDGSRMSYLGFGDTEAGVEVTFYDVQGETDPANFVPTSLGTFARSEPHTFKFVMDFVDGASNDVVEIYIDGNLVHTGTTWENYYRFDSEANAEQSPRIVKTLLFRAGGLSVPANTSNGFLFDNVTLSNEEETVPPTETEVDIYGDTTDGTTAGWMFNRDTNNATPIQFTSDTASLDNGSLFVEPLSSVGAKKFIGEYFFGDPLPAEDLSSISYDFKVAGNGTSASANQFYLNVYVSLPTPGFYYDCKYDLVPSVGSTGSFTTAVFNASDTSVVVTDRYDGSSVSRPNDGYDCPSSLAQMAAERPGSTIRFVSINMGDTQPTDQGLAGYFDKVVIATATEITTFDLEPYPAVTSKEACKNGGWVLGLSYENQNAFKNQGDCVSYFATKQKNQPAGTTAPAATTNARRR